MSRKISDFFVSKPKLMINSSEGEAKNESKIKQEHQTVPEEESTAKEEINFSPKSPELKNLKQEAEDVQFESTDSDLQNGVENISNKILNCVKIEPIKEFLIVLPRQELKIQSTNSTINVPMIKVEESDEKVSKIFKSSQANKIIQNNHQNCNKNSKNHCKKCGKVLTKTHDCDLRCKFCGVKRARPNLLKMHILSFHPNEATSGQLYKCEICSKKFLGEKYLVHHQQTKHLDGKVKKFECDFDGKMFKTRGLLLTHMGVHLPKVKCLICGAQMKIRSLSVHIKEFHAGDRKFSCEICSKTFPCHSYLRVHLKGHNKKFSCEICSKDFRTKATLISHKIDFHENPRSYSCEICDQKFNTKPILKSHQKIHDENRSKPHKCQRCDFATDQKISLGTHMRFHSRCDMRVAAIKDPIKCDICSTSFRSREALNTHKTSVHPKVLFQCDLCGKFMKTKTNIKNHIQNVEMLKLQKKVKERILA